MEELGALFLIIIASVLLASFLNFVLSDIKKNAFIDSICSQNQLTWVDCNDLKSQMDYEILIKVTKGVLK